MKENSIRRIVRRNLALGLLILLFTNTILGDQLIRTKSGETARITTAPNGTPMIELANPNKSGISINNFESLSVDEKNLILNNISSQDGSIYRSELGGLITPNSNYDGAAARAVLIRVSNDPSIIGGFIEAASVRNMDFFLSNEKGIYLNGGLVGRFGNVMFTTGRITDDLMSVMVRDGRIEIGAGGFNAKTAQNLGILAREIKINGQLNNDNEISAIAGEYDYDVNTKNITKKGDNPGEVLISSSAVGGIYSRQIYLVAVGSDLGVKGDVIGDTVRINADGSVTVNKAQGINAIDVKGKNFTQEGSLYTEGNLTIDADSTKLNGVGTQAKDIKITGDLDNKTTVYAKGNIVVDKNTKSKGQIIAEKSLTIGKDLDSEELVYGAEEVNVGGNLNNKSDLQTEGNVNIAGDTNNQGKIVAGNKLDIKGNLDNSGTAYGETGVTVGKDLNNSGSLQSTGDIQAKNTKNTGKIISEKNITIKNLENSNEIIANGKITSDNIDNKTTGKLNAGDTITANGNATNQGSIRTNGSFSISGNYTNYNETLVGGNLVSRDIINSGSMKVSEKITGRGTFTNIGEILANNLDVDTIGNISNTNKIVVLEDSKLKGNNINNAGYLSSTNLEITTPTFTNSGVIEADKKITANNTTLNNTGYIGSNQELNLNGSNISNQGKLESANIVMNNLFAYNNLGGIINSNSVTLSSNGSLILNGSLHGESYVKVESFFGDILIPIDPNIVGNQNITSIGKIEISGRDVTNDTIIGADEVVIGSSRNLVNTNLIEGNRGTINGLNITNNGLIAFADTLNINAKYGKIINNAGMAIYGGNSLDIDAEFGEIHNLHGELLSLGDINLKADYLLNQVGTIQSTNDINLVVNKIDNIGEVAGLDQYEKYYETWDGQILTETEVMSSWKGENQDFTGNAVFLNVPNMVMLNALNNSRYQFWFANKFFNDIAAILPPGSNPLHNPIVDNYFDGYTTGDGVYLITSSAQYPVIALKGKIRSNAITTYSNILAGRDITINGSELNNKDGKISAGDTATLNVGTIKNQTSLGNPIQLRDGVELYKQEFYDSKYHIKYWRGFETADTAYVSGQASVIEANRLIINTNNLILTPEISAASQIINGSSTSGTGGLSGKNTNAGKSNNGTGEIVIQKNMDTLTEIKASGVLSVDPLGAKSSLFTTTTDQTSKYLLETRSKYINLASFYGSDYFLSRLGYDESSEWNRARRLGDAYYEYLIVTRAISDKLGTRFINGLSDKELMKAMLDNSVDVQKDLQLTVGVSLTPSQVKALKSDIIWYEYEIVDGQKVLVPKVYLSQTTLATIEVDGRNKIGGLELTAINADEIRNNGQLIGNGGVTYVNAGKVYNVTDTNELSEIRGNQVTVIATKGNIENIGGKIKGIESVVLSAENGDIINSSSKSQSKAYSNGRNNTEHESILSVGSIESEGTTYIEGKNYTSEAGIVSGKNTIIDVKENINIGSLTLTGSDKSGSSGGNYANYDSVQKIGSEVSGTDSVILNAGNNINVKGSMIGSDGTVQLTAENINIINEKESVKKASKSTDDGFMSTHSIEEKSYQEGAVGSTIVGNNVILDAKNDINIKASNVIAIKDGIENTGGNIIATAGNNINILADTLDNSYSRKEKSSGFSTSLTAGGGGLSVGVSYSKNSLEQTSNGTTVAVSTLMSEGSTLLDAGNKIRTEAMQANIGEDLIIRGKNGVELLDAKETYEEKTKQSSSSIGVTASLSSTVTSFVDTASNMYNNKDKYGTDNASQMINSAGDGFTLFRGGVSAFNDGQAIYDSLVSGIHPANPLAGISASVSLSVSKSSFESNTSGTKSIAGNINVGGNMIVESEGDVRFINQKINVGENILIDAKSFEARAGENTYTNDTKSSSSGGSIGYDFGQGTAIGGINGGKGNSNTTSKSYDNTVINAGGTFQLITKEDATFAGANVKADKINFDIGGNLNVISLQDEYSSHGKNYSGGLGYSDKDITTKETQTGKGTASVSYGENNADAKWVSNQTSIIAENGGNIKVNETLTNTGAIIASINDSLSIDAKKLVTEDLKDYNNSENYNIGLSGIELNGKNQVPQTSVSYGSTDKEQNTNATFSNVVVTENGTKVDLEARGINTDLSKAQVVTKDEKVEQIDTMLHTDLLNTETREAFVDGVKKASDGIKDIANASNDKNLKYEDARTNRYGEYYIETHKGMAELIDDPGSKTEAEIKAETKAFIKYLTGKDVEVVITADGEGSGYLRGDQKGKDLSDVFILDMKQLASGEISAAFVYGHEVNHTDDHRRGRKGHNEVDSDSSGNRLEEILGDKGKSKIFDLDEWKNKGSNGKALSDGEDLLNGEYAGYDVERAGGDRGLNAAEQKAQKCMNLACMGTSLITIINIKNDLQLDGAEANKQIANKKINDPKCKKDCKTEAKKELKEAESLYVKTKEGYIVGLTPKEVDKLNELKESSSYYGLPKDTIIIIKDENGKELKFNSLIDLEKYGTVDEQKEQKKYADLGTKAYDKARSATTKEEKDKYNKIGDAYYTEVNKIMTTVQERRSRLDVIQTGKYAVDAGISYDGKTLVISSGKMKENVDKEGISIAVEGAWKGIAGGILAINSSGVGNIPKGTSFKEVTVTTPVSKAGTANGNSKDILYNNGGELQTPYNKAREIPILMDGKYKDARTKFTLKGSYTYVIDAEGNLQMAKSSKLGMEGGHTSLSGGKPVKYAGIMEFSNGKLKSWSNGSGHYEPSASQASEISDILKSLGLPDATMSKFEVAPIKP